MSIIELVEVSKSFKGRPLYSGINISVAAGEAVAITGPNGSGKSVLFKLMCKFIEPDQGEVAIDPEFMSSRRDFPERFGVLIDRPGYIPSRSGLDNLLMLARIRNELTREEVAHWMREFGLDPAMKQHVRHYSLGMKQKLSLIQAFMENPKVLLLDEPFNALDDASVRSLRERLKAFVARGGTLVFTSHNNDDVATLATRVFRFDEGRLEAVDS